ncbi:hypothetical protein KA047_01890 [Candidatus Saccharibacteria bacterium]|nr:hypothetical protein [Candidatus Saccharibacteria bacterium]
MLTAPDKIIVLQNINPEEVDGGLHSPKLAAAIAQYDPAERAMWEQFMDAEPDTAEEITNGMLLADYYHLKTADRLQHDHRPHETGAWMDRFTQASAERYGAPILSEVVSIAQGEHQLFSSVSTDNPATRVYEQLAGVQLEVVTSTAENIDLAPFREAVFEKFAPIISCVEAAGEGPHTSEKVRQVFTQIIDEFARTEPEWANWSVYDKAGETTLSVVAEDRGIIVPDARPDVENKEELLALALHEIGVHAWRAVSGYAKGDTMLANGLYQYGFFEEGFGKLMEILVGRDMHLARDLYTNVALAAGTVPGVRLDRHELNEVAVNRVLIRARAADSQPAESDLKKALNGVRRVLRGGTGKALYDQSGNVVHQAVFTKDIAYYGGFALARGYVEQELQAGRSALEILEYMLLGKFDPTISQHRAYVGRYQ